jgi:AcrR family transcriptional regulator
MSSCNVRVAAPDTADDTENAILDAAAECVLAFGVRRTSLSDVARRAGVSRPTVYRRWPDLRALVADLMTRELAAVFSRAARDRARPAPCVAGSGREQAVGSVRQQASGPVREQAVSQFLAAARELQAHPLLSKIIQVDPELLMPYIFDRLGTSQRMALGLIADRIAEGQRDRSIRAGEATAMASTVLLCIQSLVLSARLTAGLVTPGQREAEAALLLDRYLSPGPQAGASGGAAA